jgi:hypothetical protein
LIVAEHYQELSSTKTQLENEIETAKQVTTVICLWELTISLGVLVAESEKYGGIGHRTSPPHFGTRGPAV